MAESVTPHWCPGRKNSGPGGRTGYLLGNDTISSGGDEPVREPQVLKIPLTADPVFWNAVDAAKAFHRVTQGRQLSTLDLVGPALQALKQRTGAIATKRLEALDIGYYSRKGTLRLPLSTKPLADEVAMHLMATDARRTGSAPGHRRHYWRTTRAVVLVALYMYGLACRAILISTYGKDDFPPPDRP